MGSQWQPFAAFTILLYAGMASNSTTQPKAQHPSPQPAEPHLASSQQTAAKQCGILCSITNILKGGLDPSIQDIGGFPKGPGGNPFGGG